MYILPITCGHYFHIYNRGIHNEAIFKEPENYDYFLRKYFTYCSDVVETLSYVFMEDHFHLVIYAKQNIAENAINEARDVNTSCRLRHFFKNYEQAVNKTYNRTGPLFEHQFGSKPINNKSSLMSVISYCHYNPQLHQLTNDFRTWQYSSYQSIVNNDNTHLASQKVLSLFSGVDKFEHYHRGRLKDGVSDLKFLATA